MDPLLLVVLVAIVCVCVVLASRRPGGVDTNLVLTVLLVCLVVWLIWAASNGRFG